MTRSARYLVALLLVVAFPACNKDLVCPTGEAACDGRCVAVTEDPSNCGACGRVCGALEECTAGACVACEGECGRADAYVACYWTNEVKPRTLALKWAGQPIDLGTARPATLDVAGGNLYVGSGQPQASLSIVPLGGGVPSSVALPGYDLNTVRVHGDALLVTNSAVGTLEILALDGTVLDEIPMPGQQDYPNPHGVAVVGSTAYVALNSAQKVAKVDLSGLASCAAPDLDASVCGQNGACPAGRRCIDGICRLECGSVTGTIDLQSVAGATDGAGLPLPSAVVTDGARVFVTLSNLAWGQVEDCDGFSYDWYSVPAGPGRVVAIDPFDADAVTTISLGEGCKSPSGLALDGSKLWASCGAYCFPEVAPGALVEIDLAGGDAVSAALPLGSTIGGKIAFCGGRGYVTDQRKTGAVIRFDPSARTTEAPVVICGADENGNALAADLECTE